MALRAAAAAASSSRRFSPPPPRPDEKGKLIVEGQVSFPASSLPPSRGASFRLISKLNPFPGMKHLDQAGGTGDVAFRVLERIKSVSHSARQGTDIEVDTHIYVCDINPNMLNVEKKHAAERGYIEEHRLSWIQGDAEL